jgi:hypothetical protein
MSPSRRILTRVSRGARAYPPEFPATLLVAHFFHDTHQRNLFRELPRNGGLSTERRNPDAEDSQCTRDSVVEEQEPEEMHIAALASALLIDA